MVILPSTLLASDSTLKVMGIEGGHDGEITLYSLHNVSIHLKNRGVLYAYMDVTTRALVAYL